MTDTPRPKTSDETLLDLEAAINTHFKTLWAEHGDTSPADYIPDWLVVINFVDLTEEDDEPSTAGYTVETRKRMAPHAIRGLLEEGLDWLADHRMGDD